MQAKAKIFSIAGRLKSVNHACAGIADLIRSEHNAWIHLLATLLVITLGWRFQISAIEWCVIVLAIAIVWLAEALNTAIEILCDATVPNQNPLIKRCKDMSAGAVMICAIGAAVVGLIIFIPYL